MLMNNVGFKDINACCLTSMDETIFNFDIIPATTIIRKGSRTVSSSNLKHTMGAQQADLLLSQLMVLNSLYFSYLKESQGQEMKKESCQFSIKSIHLSLCSQSKEATGVMSIKC
jgi:hypothetical protein